jgi:hypothetical protein
LRCRLGACGRGSGAGKGLMPRPQFEYTPELICLVKATDATISSRKLRQAGLAARETRAAKWRQADQDISAALESVPWHELARAQGLTTYDHQLWARLRHHQLFVRQFGDAAAGCSSFNNPTANTDSPVHLAWECERTAQLWNKLARFWGAEKASDVKIRKAVFARTPPASLYDWRGLFEGRATCVSDRLEHRERILWGQLAFNACELKHSRQE